ncbi:MAG: SpoIID/LytB domain-containing protein [Porcipelethomonas sp.]
MNFFKSKKCTAVILSALLLGSSVFGGILSSYSIRAVEDEPANNTHAASASENRNKPASILKEAVVLWKAELSDYSSSFSLTNYEIVDAGDEDTEEAKKTESSGNAAENAAAAEQSAVQSDYRLDYVNGATNYTVPEREYVEPASIESGNFGFTTYGYGHGLGLSQNGANYYATYGGWGYQTILAHYYPGTYIQNTGTASGETITAGGISGNVLDIVSMVVYNEMSDCMNAEAMKAQAVAAYSYIKYKGGNAPDLCPRSNPPENVVNAVRQVLGEALYYNGSYALAMFGASSGGATASCYDIFYEDIPYLRSVSCDYDAQCDPHYGTVVAMSASEVKYILESNYGIALSDDPNNWIQVIEGDGGYAASVVIDGQVTVKGNEFKICLGLKSPKFTCQYYS